MRGSRRVPTGRIVTTIAEPQPHGRYLPEGVHREWTGAGSPLTPPMPGTSVAVDPANAPIAGPEPIRRPSKVIFPPEYIPPPDAIQFNQYVQVNSVAVGTTPLWTFAVPSGSILVIKGVDVFASNTTAASNIVFGIFGNNIPYGQYGAIPLFPGVAAVNARSFNEQTFRFTAPMTVSMSVTNNDGGAYTLAASAQGWYYSTALNRKYQ